MAYLIDTNTLIALLNPATRDPIRARIKSAGDGEVMTSAIVAHELYYGAYHSAKRNENLMGFARLFRDIPPLAFSEEDGRAAGEIRADLRAKGTPIGPYDVLIAGQALARGLMLITHNACEFSRVKGLKTVNWIKTKA